MSKPSPIQRYFEIFTEWQRLLKEQPSYIDAGDEVVIKDSCYILGSDDLSKHIGKRGVVRSNNGSGKCSVFLHEDKIEVVAWNAHDLELCTPRLNPEEEIRKYIGDDPERDEIMKVLLGNQ